MALGFFRRNTKMVVWIMVILMGMFLLGTVGASTILQWFRPSGLNEVLATAGDTELTRRDFRRGAIQLRILRRLGLGHPKKMLATLIRGESRPVPGADLLLLLRAEPQDDNGRLVRLRMIRDQDAAVIWTLLLHEAKGMGLEADGLLVDQFIHDSLYLDDDGFTRVLTAFEADEISEREVRDAIAGFLAVTMAFENVAAGRVEPEARLRDLYVRQATMMDVAMLQLKAEDFLDEVPTDPSGEQFEAQLDKLYQEGRKYLRNDPRNPHPMGFGYRRPARVRVEYAYIRLDDVQARTSVSEDDIYDYWQANQSEFLSSAESTTTAPATRPAAPPTFAEAKPEVRKRVRRLAAEKRIGELASELLADAQRREQEAKPGDPSPLAEAAEAMAADKVRFVAMPEALSGEQIAADPILGNAFHREGRRDIPLVALTLSVEQLLGDAEKHLAIAEVGKTFGRPLQVRGSTPGTLVLRIAEALPSIKPPLLDDEVRKQATEDWRMMQAFEIARKKAEAARLRIGEVGMTEVAEELDLEILEADNLARSTFVPGFETDRMAKLALQMAMIWRQDGMKGDLPDLDGEHRFYMHALMNRPFVQVIPAVKAIEPAMGQASTRKFLAAVFEMADDDVEGETPTTQPAAPAAVTVVEVPAIRSVIVAQRVKLTPAYEQDYQFARGALAARLSEDRRVQMMRDWVSFTELQARTDFRSVQLAKEGDDEKAE